MTKELAIVGASGHGKVIADIAEQLGFIVSFYDDAYPSKTHIEHWPIHGTCADLIALNNTNATLSNDVVVAIGNNEIRQQKIELLRKNRFNLITLIHPTAVISPYAAIASGTVVFSSAVINAFAKVGVGCIINTAAVVEHDCTIDNFTHICPNVALAGGVSVGAKSWVGISSQVKQLITIGDNCIVGAGSTVIKNIPDNVTAFGSPAVVIKSH
ncbi:acetyltransferase [Pseudoalteromonas sp. APC 3691]|uniref:acetyltransferase n=1 Tax=Pseudoalteromonas sp. APC 3691 TaxID=3035173 RepID=UPI0025B5010E|nr:acetyltransferase [Pseudoalteromonas sp. APC 3691]MDN3389548.1 acetyltransferase [Pseudoalteromonas sp. APC 3691]